MFEVPTFRISKEFGKYETDIGLSDAFFSNL